jgi:hypothetical protein
MGAMRPGTERDDKTLRITSALALFLACCLATWLILAAVDAAVGLGDGVGRALSLLGIVAAAVLVSARLARRR